MENTMIIMTLSGVLGLVCMGFMHIQWAMIKRDRQPFRYDDEPPARFFITGDKHRDFTDIRRFCKKRKTRREDVLILLGDSGLNYYEDHRDDKLKAAVASLPITLFCIHGNKECRPEHIDSYGVRTFCGGRVLYEPKYPSLLFAIDGEAYTFEDKKYIVMGGAHSVDKRVCLEEGKPFWEDEMPNDEVKKKFEDKLITEHNQIFGVMTHTCPLKYLPTEMFLSAKRRDEDSKRKKAKVHTKKPFTPDVDRSTEEWLGKIEQQTDYRVWYCGHYHIDKQIDKIYMMYRAIMPLHRRHLDNLGGRGPV